MCVCVFMYISHIIPIKNDSEQKKRGGIIYIYFKLHKNHTTNAIKYAYKHTYMHIFVYIYTLCCKRCT